MGPSSRNQASTPPVTTVLVHLDQRLAGIARSVVHRGTNDVTVTLRYGAEAMEHLPWNASGQQGTFMAAALVEDPLFTLQWSTGAWRTEQMPLQQCAEDFLYSRLGAIIPAFPTHGMVDKFTLPANELATKADWQLVLRSLVKCAVRGGRAAPGAAARCRRQANMTESLGW
eukprot:Skav201183  [mRNA]  locus=scaffold2736:184530:196445:+ [translate_table: standard]